MATVSELTTQFTKYTAEREAIVQMLKYPDKVAVSISAVIEKNGQQFKCTQAEGVQYLQAHLAVVQNAITMLNTQIKEELDKETHPTNSQYNEVDAFDKE